MASKRDYTAEEIRLALTCFCLEAGRARPTERLLRAAGLKIPMGTLRGWAYNTQAELYQQIALEVEKQVRARMADQYHRLAQTSSELSEEILDRIKAELQRRDTEIAETERRLMEVGDTEVLHDELAEIEGALAAAGDPKKDDEEAARARATLETRQRDLRLTLAKSQRLLKHLDAMRSDFKDLTKILHESGVMGGIATEKLQLLTGQATERVEHSFPEIRRALEAKGVHLGVGQGQAKPALPAPVVVSSSPAGGDDD